ncbi:MAG: hypothetical protein DRN91_07090 [Candidatus Alkanophagales archaeon]|nr:MAG: hypothetical protein DRN91_07090 [Candidatus Alkanophagales archaeon]
MEATALPAKTTKRATAPTRIHAFTSPKTPERAEKMNRSRRHKLADFLEKRINQKPYDDYICIDKQILWKIIRELRQ